MLFNLIQNINMTNCVNSRTKFTKTQSTFWVGSSGVMTLKVDAFIKSALFHTFNINKITKYFMLLKNVKCKRLKFRVLFKAERIKRKRFHYPFIFSAASHLQRPFSKVQTFTPHRLQLFCCQALYNILNFFPIFPNCQVRDGYWYKSDLLAKICGSRPPPSIISTGWKHSPPQ